MAQQSCGEQREKKKNNKRTLKEGKKVAWKAKIGWDKRWDGCQKMWKVNRKVTVLLCHRSGSKKWKTGSGCERRIRQWERSWPRGLMDKAPASGAGDCGFESRRGRDAFKFLFFSCHAKPRDRISSLYLFSKKKALFWFLLVWGNKSNVVFVPVPLSEMQKNTQRTSRRQLVLSVAGEARMRKPRTLLTSVNWNVAQRNSEPFLERELESTSLPTPTKDFILLTNGPYSPKGKKWRPRAPGGIMPR